MSDRPRRHTEQEYLSEIEALSKTVIEEALAEGWLRFTPDLPDATPFQHAVNELARHLRYLHTADDGCVEHMTGDDRAAGDGAPIA